MKISHHIAAALSTLLFIAAGPVLADRPIDERRDFVTDGFVEVSNVAGDIEVTAWDREEIHVTGNLWEGAERLEFTVDGRRALIKVVVPRHSQNIRHSDLFIKVPASSELDIGGVSSDITVDGVSGEQRLRTVSGDIITAAWGDRIQAKSVSGDIDIDGMGNEGRFELGSVSGDVTVRDASGEVRAKSVSGEILTENLTIGRATLETVSGDVEFRGRLEGRAELDIEVTSGSVDVDFTDDPDAEFDIETFSGGIRNSFGPEPRRTSRYSPGEELNFVHGDGEARVRISSMSGTIRLRKP